ncbi:MAG: hypothetical protein H0X62_17290, partial [Bacteroidetes bacterium]|nr:hypothetical protein [Bacteroidota bacterium]
FLSSGHPEVVIHTRYDQENKKAVVTIEQIQDFESTPLFRLPMEVDIYVNGDVFKHKIVAHEHFEEFSFDVASKPELINVDAEKMLLGERKEVKSNSEWAFQYLNAPLFIDRFEAIESLIPSTDSLADEVIYKALSDPFESIRVLAIKNAKRLSEKNSAGLKADLIKLAKEDSKSEVRAGAIKQLKTLYNGDAEAVEVYKIGLNDKSYAVLSEALAAIFSEDENEAMKLAKSLEQEKNVSVLSTIAAIYAKNGDDSHNDFFINASKEISGFGKYSFILMYGNYLKNRSDETINAGLPIIEDAAINSAAWWMRLGGVKVLADLLAMYESQETAYKNELKSVAPGTPEEAAVNRKLVNNAVQKKKILTSILLVKEKETNENLIQVLSNFSE